MLSVDGNGRTVDPEDAAKLREWTQKRSAKQQQLTAARRQVTTLQAVLDRPDVVTAKREETEAGQELTRATGAASTAQQQYDSADAEAKRFEGNELAAAIAALDDATAAVSQTLADLMKDSTVSAALSATVDGLALHGRYRAATAGSRRWDHTTIPFPATPADVIDPQLALPAVHPADGTDYRRVLAVLDRLDDRVDAVADLIIAESVHQLVQGNATRSRATLAVAAEGRVPDQFDVIRTPRPGSDVTHRLAVLLDPARPAAWTTSDPGPASQLDPITDTWATRLLPDPAEVHIRVHWVAADATPAADPTDLPLADLALDALGWVRVAANTAELTHRLALGRQPALANNPQRVHATRPAHLGRHQPHPPSRDQPGRSARRGRRPGSAARRSTRSRPHRSGAPHKHPVGGAGRDRGGGGRKSSPRSRGTHRGAGGPPRGGGGGARPARAKSQRTRAAQCPVRPRPAAGGGRRRGRRSSAPRQLAGRPPAR